MRVLMVMDPLPATDLEWDTNFITAVELARRGHEIWSADVTDLGFQKATIMGYVQRLHPESEKTFHRGIAQIQALESFDLILCRKEPPFDVRYLYLTYLLEQISSKVPVLNDPRGIRDANEKLITLRFPDWLPETVVTSETTLILKFQEEIDDDIILKPLDQKGGKGILLVTRTSPDRENSCRHLTENGRRLVIAQRFLRSRGGQKDKRILLLEGEFFAAYEKHCAKDEYRANLALGATYHATTLSDEEQALVAAMKPFLLARGLYFVGADVMNGKLLEVNVTCPAGLSEAQALYPEEPLVRKWGDYLEHFQATHPLSSPPHPAAHTPS